MTGYGHCDPYNPRPIWENFRGLFRAIDQGSERLKIAQYNGGLFAADPLLDALAVPDEVCRHFKVLSDYNYCAPQDLADVSDGHAPIIDVDILGHIFEQSITDLEKLRNELEGKQPAAGSDKHKTRRKKEGAFYTPAFITRYIVEQALGNNLADRFERLRQEHAADATASAKAALADPRVYDVAALNKSHRSALVGFWETWQAQLQSIRVLDPACGSGAFLIEAFDQLHDTYTASNDRLEELRGHRTLFDLDRQILQHNLYGVDLNDEAIDICRLSLWIKTAQRGKILTSLDHTIRCGNSVVDDPAVGGDKAFNWQQAFPEVFAAGGFDVVVGNPPFIRQEWIAAHKPHWERRFSSYDGGADIFVYFYELGVSILRDGGRLGFITSGSWVRGGFGSALRSYLASSSRVESILDFGEFQPFEDSEMIRPTILVCRKGPSSVRTRVFRWLTSGKPPENLSEVIAASPTVCAEKLGAKPWELDEETTIALKQKLASQGSPLLTYCGDRILYGAKTGLNEVFVISSAVRDRLLAEDANSNEIIKPFIQGTHMRPWHIQHSEEFLIFTRRGIDMTRYPAVLNYLDGYRDRLEPKPVDWDDNRQGKWTGRKAGAYQWYELQDTVDYWAGFEEPKIVWPDISKLPRFSMDHDGRYLGNTGYAIPGGDYYLLGILASWATWFYLSKTAQPLRLRGGRWQYRLIAQFMKDVPVPEASAEQRQSIGSLARKCNDLGAQRYAIEEALRSRLLGVFRPAKGIAADLNTKATAWWTLSLQELGESLRASLKLTANPFRNPATADEWEPYLAAKRDEVQRLGAALAGAETELNERVYRLFGLTQAEVELLKREVEH